MEGKRTAGCKKIQIKKIENKSDLYASFSKRRSSLYKKASEIVRECDVDLGIVISSPADKPFSFISPTTDAVIDRFMNLTVELSTGSQLAAAQARNNVNQINDRFIEFDTREKVAKDKIHFFNAMNTTRNIGWWESIEQFSADDISMFGSWLNSGEVSLKNRLKKLENGASSSTQPPPEDEDN
ncbi:hypothetical protein RND71_020594 [Anisodus tanguticus]|uniref:MADS-box domain-containing protein n=1 Tax=Anisodus tanguticus TaxID=243964 RepID=A0AAE1VAI0_9SOLA|nr:hypothetical protein RND71_020594 [Anisodus tanguticus]